MTTPIFPSASSLREKAEKAQIRKQMSDSLYNAAMAGVRLVSFDVSASKGVHTHMGLPVRDLIAELSALGYKCKLNVDSSDRTYHLDISF